MWSLWTVKAGPHLCVLKIRYVLRHKYKIGDLKYPFQTEKTLTARTHLYGDGNDNVGQEQQSSQLHQCQSFQVQDEYSALNYLVTRS